MPALLRSPVVPLSLSACKWGTPALPAATSPGSPAAALPRVPSSTRLPVSAPPTGLDECFFNSLVVGLPYSLIFGEFWLFFVFKSAVLLLVVRGGTVCLPAPPSCGFHLVAEIISLEGFPD